MKINYPSTVSLVLQTLAAHGQQAYLVGGCVRDAIMNRPVSDYDIATDALPQRVQQIFAAYPQFDAGMKHGTITVIIDKEPIEITTFRTDGTYSDGRRPDQVFFAKTLKEDLSRRDFTINGLAYNDQEGLVDYFGGIKDIQNRVLRAIGEPDQRFYEDALRIFRGVRFAAQLEFQIEPHTYDSMVKNKAQLQHISGERKGIELVKALISPGIADSLMNSYPIYAEILPELMQMAYFDQNSPYHSFDVLEHTTKTIANCPLDKQTRLAALYHDSGKVHTYTEKNGIGHFYGHGHISETIARASMNSMKMDNNTIKNVCVLVKYHDLPLEPTTKSIRRALNKMGEALFFKLLDLKRADVLAQSKAFHYRLDTLTDIKKIALDILNSDLGFSIKHLAIDGRDLLSLNLQGPQIGAALKLALESVLEETTKNTKAELIRLIKEEYGIH